MRIVKDEPSTEPTSVAPESQRDTKGRFMPGNTRRVRLTAMNVEDAHPSVRPHLQRAQATYASIKLRAGLGGNRRLDPLLSAACWAQLHHDVVAELALRTEGDAMLALLNEAAKHRAESRVAWLKLYQLAGVKRTKEKTEEPEEPEHPLAKLAREMEQDSQGEDHEERDDDDED